MNRTVSLREDLSRNTPLSLICVADRIMSKDDLAQMFDKVIAVRLLDPVVAERILSHDESEILSTIEEILKSIDSKIDDNQNEDDSIKRYQIIRNLDEAYDEEMLADYLSKSEIDFIISHPSTKKYTDEIETIYEISKGLFLHDYGDGNGFCLFRYESIQLFLDSWDSENYNGEEATKLVAFGVEPDLIKIYHAGIDHDKRDEVIKEYENQNQNLAIWVEYNYQDSHLPKKTSHYVAEDGCTFIFSDIAEAIAKAEEVEASQYTERDGESILYLEHGQESSTNYFVVFYH